MTRRRRKHTSEQIIKKLRDADAMLAAGKSVGEVLQALEVSEPSPSRWRGAVRRHEEQKGQAFKATGR
ncbi:MAG: hypothetical protein KF752_09375 [Pirellulaceae bacterium]|nr:hypothetical protein [Pirellulaceae bacterium]